MKKIAILFVVFFCSVSLWAQTIEDDATWKLKTDTVRALKHYKAGDNWFIGIQAGANHSLSENSRFGSFGTMTRPSIALSVGKYFSPAIGARVQLAYLKQMSRANSEVIEAFPRCMAKGTTVSICSTVIWTDCSTCTIFSPNMTKISVSM